MTDTLQLLLANHLKTLRLPTFLREHDKLKRLAFNLIHILPRRRSSNIRQE